MGVANLEQATQLSGGDVVRALPHFDFHPQDCQFRDTTRLSSSSSPEPMENLLPNIQKAVSLKEQYISDAVARAETAITSAADADIDLTKANAV
jgi:hypothetical protein